MVNRAKNLVGLKSGKLTVVERGPNNWRSDAQWWCECDCGNPNRALVRTNHLIGIRPTLSCGCIQSEAAKRNVIRANEATRGSGKQWADCHPSRPHAAKGMCVECYNRHIFSTVKSAAARANYDGSGKSADCHPDRRHYAKGLCAECYDMASYHKDPSKKIGRTQRWYADNKDRVYYREMEKKFNITRKQYEQMLVNQGGVCAICEKLPTEVRYGRLQVDHDHACCSGKTSCGKCVRGLVCVSCNAGLGQFYDSIDFLAKAIAYLKRTKWINANGQARVK